MHRKIWLTLGMICLLAVSGCGDPKNTEEPTTVVNAVTDAEKENETETETAGSERETEETAESAETELQTEAPELSAELRRLKEEAKAEGALCAVSYLGYFDSIAFNADQTEANVLKHTELSDLRLDEKYPFLWEIPAEDQVAYSGEEVYAIIPADEDSILSVYEFSPVGSDGKENVIGQQLYRRENAGPILLTCNISDIMSNILVEVENGEGEKISFSPGLSLRDGSVLLPEKTLDFTAYEDDAAFEVGIRTGFYSEGTYRDDVGNEVRYRYCLPEITGDSTPYLEEIRAKLAALKTDYVDRAMKEMEDGVSLSIPWVDYQTSSCYETVEGITIYFIRVKISFDTADRIFLTYAFDNEGSEVFPQSVLRAVRITTGMDEEEFLKAAYDKVDSYLSIPDPSALDKETRNALEECREQTLSEDNINSEMPVCVSEYGTVSFMVSVYSIAGADLYEHVFILAPEGGFADEELCEMALDHYQAENGYRPGEAVVDSSENDQVTIHLYDDEKDHISTCDWYEIDRMTGKGTDLMGSPVDLTVD